MVLVRDANGLTWSVRRKWWPFPDLTDIFEDDFFAWIGFILSIPFLLVWPFWLLGKFLGVKWVIVIERDERQVGAEKIRGYYRSRRRALEIARDIANTQARYTF
ncbi:MAG: hypothetical protein ACSLE6_16305 [Mycobacterium sp.]